MATKRFPFVGQMNTRGPNQGLNFTTYDQLYQNVVFIPVKNEVTKTLTVYVEKRPGFAYVNVNYGLTTPQKLFGWFGANSGVDVLVASGVASSITRIRNATAPSTIHSHADASAVSFFSSTSDSSGTPMLIWQRANLEVWGYPYGGAVAQITTVPAGVVGRMIHLDGWSFIGVGANSRIYNSTLNNPTAGYTDYITADKVTDRLITIFLYKHFVLAFGSGGIEWFFNQGNPSGSPLSRIKERYIPDVGLLNEQSVGQGFGSVFFLGKGDKTGYGVFKFTDGSGLEKISNTIVDRIIEGLINFSSANIFSINVQTIHAIDMVLVCIKNGDERTALVYFPSVGLWSYWKTSSSTYYMLFDSITTIDTATQIITTEGLVCTSVITDNAIASTYGDPFLDNQTISRVIRTSVLDFETMKRKTQHSLRLVGDRFNASFITPGTLPVSVTTSDNDYVTNSAARTIDMYAADPALHRLGMFRRRSFTFTDTAYLPGRLSAFEVDVEINAS